MIRLDDVPIRARICLLGVLALAGLIAILFLTISKLEQTMRDDARASARLLVETVDGVLASYAARERAGELSRAEAQAAALETIEALRYGADGRFWIEDVATLAGERASRVPRDSGGPASRTVKSAEVAVGAGADFIQYQATGAEPTSGPSTEAYAHLFAPWGWVIGTDVNADGIAGAIRRTIAERAALVSSTALIVFLLSLMLARSIVVPIQAIATRMRALADGDESSPIPHAERRDEIGQMAAALAVFREALRNNVALRKARDEAAAADAAKSEFLANMSHELRTPLNSIVGFAALLEQSAALPDQERRHARLVRTASETLLEIVNEVIDFSKLGEGGVALEMLDFRPETLAADTAALMQAEAARKGLDLRVECSGPSGLWLRGDPGRIRQVLLNLLGNAVKFTDHGVVRLRTTVRPSADGERARLRFEVSDTGIGIPPQHLDRLFQRFFQGDGSASRRYGGSGLGLPISKALVELMGGDLGVSSVSGEGSTFWVELECAAAAGAHLPGPADDLGVSFAATARVLVVDDVEVNRELVGLLLRSWGCEVEEAAGGDAAVEAVAAGGYDIVLMDVHMPETDGSEATRRIRRAGADLPIVAMTADILPERIADCLAAGMTDYLSKPIHPAQLARTLARHCPDRAGSVPRPAPERPDRQWLEREFGGRAAESLLRKLDARLRASFRGSEARPDREGLRREAHALRGAVGMLGFSGLAEACKRLERACDGEGDLAASLAAARSARDAAMTVLASWDRQSDAPSDLCRLAESERALA